MHRTNSHISVNLYPFLNGCLTGTLRKIFSCPAAKWVVSDVRNAHISISSPELREMIDLYIDIFFHCVEKGNNGWVLGMLGE